MNLYFAILTEGSLDWVAVVTLLGFLILTLLGSRFQTIEAAKKEAKERDEEREKRKIFYDAQLTDYKDRLEKAVERLVELEKNQALAQQPVAAIAQTLIRIETSLNTMMAKILDMDARLIRVEGSNRQDNQGR